MAQLIVNEAYRGPYSVEFCSRVSTLVSFAGVSFFNGGKAMEVKSGSVVRGKKHVHLYVFGMHLEGAYKDNILCVTDDEGEILYLRP